MAELAEEKKNTTQTKTKPDSQLNMSCENTKTNKNDHTKSLYPVKEIKESGEREESSHDSTDDEWVFEHLRPEMNDQGDEERMPTRKSKNKKTTQQN